jgi:hypothetical protein
LLRRAINATRSFKKWHGAYWLRLSSDLLDEPNPT